MIVSSGGRRHYGYEADGLYLAECGAGRLMLPASGEVDCLRCIGAHHYAGRGNEPFDEAGMTEVANLIDRCCNMWGGLKAEGRARLFAVLDDPNPVTWDAAHSLVVAMPGQYGGATLWQAALAAGHPSVPDRGPTTDAAGNVVESWSSIPTREALMAGLRFVLERTP